MSRRTFVKGLGSLSAGTLLLSPSAVEPLQAQYGAPHADELSGVQLTAMYTAMLQIRLWETKIKDLILKGGFRGVAHLYVGQEAIAVGVCTALRRDDYIASNHRGHGHLIAKGGDLKRMPAEITHKATGYCKGYGGSLHITDLSLGILGMNGIVGASHLFAAGAAYGIEGRVVDGNDVLAVHAVAKYAVEKARAGQGPTLIECKTYRWYDHYGAGGARVGADGAFGLGYRSDRELRDWMAQDPIPRFRRFLVNEQVLTEQRAEEIVAAVQQAVEEAVRFAEAQPVPKPEDGLLNVFAEGAVPLHTS